MPFLWYRDYAQMTDEQLRTLFKTPQLPASADRSQLIRRLMARDTLRCAVFVGIAWAMWFAVSWTVHRLM